MLINLDYLIKKYELKISGIIHVGAHDCEEYPIYKKNQINNVIWIDAMKDKVDKMKKLLTTNKIFHGVIDVEDNNEVEFKITNNGQSSSILDLGLHKQFYPNIKVIKKIKCKTCRLDTLINKNKINMKNYNFINLDIQGVELNALKSLGKNMYYINYIYTEINTAEVYKNCSLVNEIDDYLKIFGFKRVETKLTNAKWGDAFYIKIL
jgi:FkbM family methyltransferase